jgi:DNA-binding transcriptional LysR family regulator
MQSGAQQRDFVGCAESGVGVSNLELDLLRAFVAVAETGGFTAAAPIVGRSQSAVSQKVIRLEEVLGQPLFSRTSRSLHLTEVGERLLAFARGAIQLNDDFVSCIRGSAMLRLLRIGVAENLASTHLTGLLSQYLTRNPDFAVDLTTGPSHHLYQQYAERQLDALIVRPRGDLPISRRIIWREPLIWMAGKDYADDPAGPVRLVTLRPPCNYRKLMIDALNRRQQPWVTSCVTNSVVGLISAVVAGMGITALGQSFLHSGLRVLEGWPELPATEIMVVGEDGPAKDVIVPLARFLDENIEAGVLLAPE